ncbi:ecdysteroid 22-kinase family protein [Nocardia sp. CA2R105]|uniref:ecdysteroid 22-kinase family protein n=1 Tax=Nocardia coffeae TaxID=2873381 RepID=UPI001CA71B5C|nr:ecdysteroid 22-kinase family protein [Nocardia coffeae]MBY8862327.1 ecdysteroid 22-kinase family protein [Nocardia coffeae]
MDVTNSPAPHDEQVVLSTEWLSSVLAQRYPDAIATYTEVTERLETVATKVRFRVGYARQTAAPDALCAKGYFDPAHRRGTRAEADFYRLVAHDLPVRTPPCVYTGVDADTGHALILMHDLVEAGARFLDPLVGYSAEQAARTLDQLAALHAATWGASGAPLAAEFPPRLASLARLMSTEQIQQLLDDGRAQGISLDVRRADRLVGAMAAMEASAATSPMCLVHGDLHAGNIYELADGSPGLIDWQVVQRGVWALDVGYHLATVLDPDELARVERDLLDHYLDRLAAYGAPPPGREHAWLMYRSYLPYGMFMWAITRAVDRPIIEHFTRRLSIAVDRHTSFDLLGV